MQPTISVVVATILAAGFSMTAGADDSGLGRFDGEGFGNFQVGGSRAIAAPSTYRRETPNGVSEKRLPGDVILGPRVASGTGPRRSRETFRLRNPNGLSVQEYQALSSNSPVWKLPEPSRGSGHS